MSNRVLATLRAKIDFETASELDVRDVGAARYAEHPTTRILCMGWKIGRGERRIWTPDQPFPQELIDFAKRGGTFEAHNAMFECAIWLNILHRRMGVPMPKRWYDTMARCAQRALPMGLDEVGRVLNLETKKDKKGKYLLQKLTKPRKPLKREVDEWAARHGVEPLPKKATEAERAARAEALKNVPPMPTLWHDSSTLVPDDWEMPDGSPDNRTLFQALCDYCAQDVDAEDVLGSVVGDMDDNEYRLWVLDQKINWRGVQVDVDAVESALEIVAQVEEKYAAELSRITGGAVTGGSQVARIKEWALSQLYPEAMSAILAETDKKARAALVTKALMEMASETGINLLSLAKDQVEQALDDGADFDDGETDGDEDTEVPEVNSDSPAWPKVKRVLEIRQILSRSSTKKLLKILECMCSDGRVRGMLQYHGAGTGRWAGRLVQPHNFPRGNPKIIKRGIESLIEAIKCRSADLLEMLYGDAMDAISTALRGMFVAGNGKRLWVADFSAIEARVTMWLAGEEEALEAFHKSDRGEGPDIYCVMAMKLYERPINKKDNPEERQLGKITILGCFEADTRVLTNNGVKPIVEVKTDDLLWDGEEWVRHDGLLDQGLKATIRLSGVGVTPDHEVLAGDTWVSAITAAQNESILSRCLERGSANLPSWVPRTTRQAVYGTLSSNAHAVPGRTECGCTTSSKERAPAATCAQSGNRDIGESDTSDMRISSLTKNIASDCLIESQPASSVVTIRSARSTPTMVDAASTCMGRGAKTVDSSLHTSSASKDGTIPLSNSTERKSIEDTSPEISASSRVPSTWEIGEAFESCNNTSQSLKRVFDIANAGPRHRFTIITDDGPMIAHNCGYQMGPDKLQFQAKKDYKVDLTAEQAEFLVSGYRNSFPKVKDLWYGLQEAAISAVLYPGRPFSFRGITYLVEEDAAGKWLSCELPNGRKIWYKDPEVYTEQAYSREGKPYLKKSLRYWGRDSKKGGMWNCIRTYGGMLTENVVQAIARDIMAEAMVRVELAGYPIILTVHDEIVAETDDDFGDQEEFETLMKVCPVWAAGCPINVEGWTGHRYKKA